MRMAGIPLFHPLDHGNQLLLQLRKLLSECVGGITPDKTEIHNAAATLDNALLGLIGQICAQRYINIKVVSSAVEHFLAEIEEADGKYDCGIECEFREEENGKE